MQAKTSDNAGPSNALTDLVAGWGSTPWYFRDNNMHPELRHLGWFLSAFGAGVALNDLDQDGLANDVCYVDTRTSQIIVAPVPGTGDRYRPFALSFEADGKKLFDRETTLLSGCLPGDLDEDGRMDLVVFFWGRTPIAFLS